MLVGCFSGRKFHGGELCVYDMSADGSFCAGCLDCCCADGGTEAVVESGHRVESSGLEELHIVHKCEDIAAEIPNGTSDC